MTALNTGAVDAWAARPERERRTLLGMPWFATVALSVAGVLIACMLLLLVRQLAVIRHMDANTDRIQQTEASTQAMEALMGTMATETRNMPGLYRAAKPFFSRAGVDLHRTADGVPGLAGTVSKLDATAAPAFRELEAGTLSQLPQIAGSVRELDTLPQAVTGQLGAVERTLTSVDHSLGGVHGDLGGVVSSLHGLPAIARALGTVGASTRSLPTVVTLLEALEQQIASMNSTLGDVDQHVASLDHRTAVLGAIQGK